MQGTTVPETSPIPGRDHLDATSVRLDTIAREERVVQRAPWIRITVCLDQSVQVHAVFNVSRQQTEEQLQPQRQALRLSVIVTLDTDLARFKRPDPSITRTYARVVLPDIPSQRPVRHLLPAPRVLLAIFSRMPIKPRALYALVEAQPTASTAQRLRVRHVPSENIHLRVAVRSHA